MGKRFFAVLLALVCLLPCAILPVAAEESLYQYEERVSWGGVELTGYSGPGGEVIVPSEIDGKKVVSVGPIFKNVSVTKVTISEGIRFLSSTFCNQSDLREVILPHSLEEIRTTSFYKTGLRTLTLPEGVNVIALDAICYNDYLKTISIPASCQWVATASIHNNPVLTKFDLGSNHPYYTTVANGTLLMQKSSNEVVASANGAVPRVLEVPNQVTHIRSCSLSGCPNLEVLILPESVDGMDGDVVSNCPKFTTIYAKAPSFNLAPYAFYSIKGQVTVYCNASPDMEPSENFTVKPYVSGMENEALTTAAAKNPTQAPAKTDSTVKSTTTTAPTETTALTETTSEMLSEMTTMTETETGSEIPANWSLRPDAATPNHRGAIIGGTVAGALVLGAGIALAILWKKGKLPLRKKK
ncbi:MAG: leucine-rich repeat protein [Candidatus Fimenecus sp.]